MSNAYEQLLTRVRDVGRLGSIEQLLDWDQEVNMPPRGADVRAEQLALLAGLSHERFTADETGELLDRAEPADDEGAVNVRETKRAFDRAVKLPTDLVKALARAASLAKNAWTKARAENKFEIFSPHLSKLIDLKKQVAERIGFETEAYDALMDEFEPGATAAKVEALFASLRDFTVALIARLENAPRRPDASILTRHYPKEAQAPLCRMLAESLGFDFNAGRADVSVHPFCTTIGGSGDVRITTRYWEDFLPAALFGTLHEVGHGLYEQGLMPEHVFTPMGEAVSLGIHESQSRLWENLIGRSLAFWQCHYHTVQGAFPEALGDVSLESFYGAINAVKPSMIRVEADEVTYNLHIILRFEIERALFSGSLEVSDVPGAWNDKMKTCLGITPGSDAEGCLQDIHWSMGAFGYFPTYALGNLYAAQFFEKARADLPDLDDRVARGDHEPLLHWLREHIHRHGKRFTPGELVERVTGRALTTAPFEAYITHKVAGVYGL